MNTGSSTDQSTTERYSVSGGKSCLICRDRMAQIDPRRARGQKCASRHNHDDSSDSEREKRDNGEINQSLPDIKQNRTLHHR